MPSMGAKLKIEFRRRKFAMLCLQRPAWMEEMLNDAIVRHYAASHVFDWLESIQRSTFLFDLDLKDLVFVTGLVKASQFETVASKESSSEHAVDLQFAPGGILELSFGYSSSHECDFCPIHAWGPRPYWDDETNGPASAEQMMQCSGDSGVGKHVYSPIDMSIFILERSSCHNS
jgi:hypothetical protein